MGYDVHITRGRHWTDDEPAITLAEWKAYVEGDAEMELTGAAEAQVPDGSVLRYENEGLAVWKPGGECWFDFRDGGVVVKNPDEPTILKMVAVARVLGATVQGDDGETYDESGQGTPRAADAVPEGAVDRRGRPSLFGRLAAWLDSWRRPQPMVEPAKLPFSVGDRVRDMRGGVGVIEAIDLGANHGAGSITVAYDDGRSLTYWAIAHDLEKA